MEVVRRVENGAGIADICRECGVSEATGDGEQSIGICILDTRYIPCYTSFMEAKLRSGESFSWATLFASSTTFLGKSRFTASSLVKSLDGFRLGIGGS